MPKGPLTQLYGPAVQCKPNVNKWTGGLSRLYPALARCVYAPGHHGYYEPMVGRPIVPSQRLMRMRHCVLRDPGHRLGDERLSEVARMGGELVSDFLAGGG